MTPPTVPACEVCGADGHADGALPGLPVSASRCETCLVAGAVPYHLLVSHTADNGGESHARGWWADVIDDTLRVLGVRHDEFTADVMAACEAAFFRDMPPDPKGYPW